MSAHNRPNGPTYFTDNPLLTLAQIKATIDAELNALASTVNSLDNANIDGSPAIALSKIDLTGADFVPISGGNLTGILGHIFEGVWQRFRASGNGLVRQYNATSVNVMWGVCYNTEYNSGWSGRDITDICWRLEVQSDGLHFFWAVSAASGVSPVWTEIFHVGTTGVFQITNCVQTSNIQTNAITRPKLSAPAVGDYVIHTNSIERTGNNTAYGMLKQTNIGTAGTYRIKFEIKTNATLGFGRVYKNGVAFGTEQSTASTTYVEKSEDLTFAEGDMIEVYAKIEGTGSVEIQNLNICVSTPLIAGSRYGY